MNTSHTATNYFDVARLARQNWQRDGSPPGREADYHREAEQQIEALRCVLAYDRKAITVWNTPRMRQPPTAIKKLNSEPMRGDDNLAN